VVESYDPEPWGLLMPGRTLGSGTKEGFTGKERDVESGLDYFGARHYMAAVGRWTSADPLAEKHPEWSAYNYALNRPLTMTDPDGRIPLFVAAIVVWAIRAAPVAIKLTEIAIQLLDPNPNDPGSAAMSAGKAVVKRTAVAADKAAETGTKVSKFLEGDDVVEVADNARKIGEVTGTVDRLGAQGRRLERLRGNGAFREKILTSIPRR
jgi:RHS repeat-associated protein